MTNPSNQNSQQPASKNNPHLAPDALQGTDDTQSEFSVNEIRAERRENEKGSDEQTENAASPSNETDAAETQSEFSVHDRQRGQS